MSLVADQGKTRAGLVAERQATAEKLAGLKVKQATIETQRAKVASGSGRTLYLAKLIGS